VTHQLTDASAMIEFCGAAHGRMPTLVLSGRGEDQSAQDRNKRNNHPSLVEKEEPHPTEGLAVVFPIYLPTLRQRMASHL
jgi:hypothetical protein